MAFLQKCNVIGSESASVFQKLHLGNQMLHLENQVLHIKNKIPNQRGATNCRWFQDPFDNRRAS